MAKRALIEASYDFSLWGINSGMEDYRLCHELNRHRNWHFKRVDDIEIGKPDSAGYKYFKVYKYENPIDFYTLELLQNKNAGNILVPELKNFDFLFLLHGEEAYFEKESFTESLRRIQGVQSAIELDVHSLKSKSNLLIRHFNDKQKKN